MDFDVNRVSTQVSQPRALVTLPGASTSFCRPQAVSLQGIYWFLYWAICCCSMLWLCGQQNGLGIGEIHVEDQDQDRGSAMIYL